MHMKVPLLALLVSLTSVSQLSAQWLNHPTPGLPRTTDGRPDLSSPAPRTPDGKPDLSGIWRLDGLRYSFNVFGTQTVEMLPWARELHAKRALSFAKDSPETNCLPAGPRAGLFGMAPVKFVQTAGLLLILYEEAPTRQVFLDGRQLPDDPNPTWMGYSVGRWEDDTLVVETAGFNDRTWLDLSGRPHTEALRVTERFRRLDVGRMRLDMTFDDPKTYTRPWTITLDVQLVPDTELLENVCNENEKDRQRLVGRVEDERAHEVRVPAAILARYAGTYSAGPLGTIRVFTHGHALAIELSGGAPHAAFATSEEDFLVPDLGVPMTFLKNTRGEVTHLRVTSVEGDIDAQKLPEHSRPH
jgi:hypothetical protein